MDNSDRREDSIGGPHDVMADVTVSKTENFGADLDFGVMDYLALPEYGDGYFNLVDASLLAALDAWWMEHGGDDPDPDELIANNQAREAARPTQQAVLKALLRSISLQELKVHVFARHLATSAPVPERTYAHIGDIQDCLEKYGLGNGHLLESAKSLDDDDFYNIAESVTRRRAAIRLGISPLPEEIPNGNPFDVIAHLRKELRAKRLQVAHLEQQGAHRIADGGQLGSRQRENLYRAIGALLTLALPHFNDKQDALIAAIEAEFPKVPGLSKRTLESVFPMARRALKTSS